MDIYMNCHESATTQHSKYGILISFIYFYVMGYQSHRHLQGHLAPSRYYWWKKTPHTRISKFPRVCVKLPTHLMSAGWPPHMKMFAPTATRTHAVRCWDVRSQRPLFLDYGRPLEFEITQNLTKIWKGRNDVFRSCICLTVNKERCICCFMTGNY